MQIVSLLQLIVAVLVMIILILIAIYVYLVYSDKHKKAKNDNMQIGGSGEYGNQEKSKRGYESGKFQGVLTKESINDFLDFDEIIDNMIIRKDRTQYIMVIQCNGVNYDLMSEQEKLSVEEGFVQFLNTLRFPIQLYIQTRSLNLRDIIEEYKLRVAEVSEDIEKLSTKIAQAEMSGNKALKEKLEFEKRRKENVLEYGMDITEYVARMSSNRNVLQQKTYVVVSYYTAEFGGGLDTYSKEDIDGMCFSELYTRCQNVMSALMSSEVTSKILDSEELAELLYVAYNRDDSEIYQLSKALDAQYDALYSTGKDVLEKKQRQLDDEIALEAVNLATDSIVDADKLRQPELIEREQKIKEKALDLIEEYKDKMDNELYEGAKDQVEKKSKKRIDKATKNEVENENSKIKVTRRKRTKKTEE